MLCPILLCLVCTGPGPITLAQPDYDRWNYPFNASPGSRSVGSTFSSYGSDYDFDNRDGQVLLGWHTDLVVADGWPASAYEVSVCTITIAIASDDVPYDPTMDPLDSYEVDGPADADAGRPVVVSGVGFRNGWDGWTFGESGPFGAAMTSRTRNCFAADLDGAGVLRDISNSLTDGFVPNNFAIGQSDDVAPGEILPAYSRLTFEVDVNDPDIQCYLRTGLADGLLEVMVTSLHESAEPGTGDPGIWPDWILKENALVGMGIVDAASLTVYATLTEPSGVFGDIDGDGQVSVNDLLRILEDFGPCPCCPTDLDESGAVTVDDLLLLIGAWGA